MRVLLDTHVLLWALRDPSRLSPRARDLLRDRATDPVCSAALAWEIATKHRLGRLPESDAIVAAYSTQLDRLGASELSVTPRHAILAGQLEWSHGDPFDRMLAAQSILEGIPLMTADRAFATHPGVAVVW